MGSEMCIRDRLNIVLFELNHRQWDPLVAMVFNSFLWLASGMLLLHVAYRNNKLINSTTVALFIFILWVFPLSLFNVLSTIQSLNYFMILFVLLGCYLLTSTALSAKWFLGLACIAAAGLSYAGGILAPIVISIISFILALFCGQQRRQHLSTGIATAILSLASIHHIITHVLSSNATRSASWDAFAISLAKNLSWPLSAHAWPFIIMLMPLFLFTVTTLRSKDSSSRLSNFTLFIGGFSVAIAVSIAQSRGINGAGPANRYYEFMSIYLIANLFALQQLSNAKQILGSKKWMPTLSFLWVAAIVSSIGHQVAGINLIIGEQNRLVPVQSSLVSDYVYTKNEQVFKNRRYQEVPFNSASALAGFINDFDRDDMLPYQLQLGSMKIFDTKQAFTINGFGFSPAGLYRRHEPVMGSFHMGQGGQNSKGKYISEYFAADRPYIMIPTLGYLGADNTSLKLVGRNNKDEKINPGKLTAKSRDVWQHTIVAAPDTEYSIHAVDNSSSLWFAYAAPRTVGRLSYYVYRMFGYSTTILISGLMVLLFCLRKFVFRVFDSNAGSLNP